MTPETWAPVRWAGDVLGGGYEVSNLGRVRNRHGLVLKPRRGHGRGHEERTGKAPYDRVQLCRTGLPASRRTGPDAREFYVRHLVLEAFASPRPDGHHGDHRNADHLDNRLANLSWRPALDNTTRAPWPGWEAA